MQKENLAKDADKRQCFQIFKEKTNKLDHNKVNNFCSFQRHDSENESTTQCRKNTLY